MPNHALYYPDWDISDPVFLAESLLYWDRLGCIVPFKDFKPVPWHQDPEMQKVMTEAHELYVSGLVPTEEQKMRVHSRLEKFAASSPPEWCRPANLKPDHRQIFSAYKFAPATVELLRNSGWASNVKGSERLDLQMIADSAANLVFSVMADEVSSSSMPPITDDPGSFTANCNSLLAELGSTKGLSLAQAGAFPQEAVQQSDVTFLLARVPHLSIIREGLNPTTFRHILQARANPQIDYSRLTFRNKVDEYLERLRTAEGGERDMVVSEFQDAFRTDLELYQSDLKRIGLDAVFSKEGAVAVLIGVLTGVASVGIGLVFGLTGGLMSYQQKRRQVVKDHWSSWAFSTSSSRFSVF